MNNKQQQMQNDPTIVWGFHIESPEFLIKVSNMTYPDVMGWWNSAKRLANEELLDMMISIEQNFGLYGHSKGNLRISTECKAITTVWEDRSIAAASNPNRDPGDYVVRHRCPDRGDGHSLPDAWNQFGNGQRICSNCGSLHPDDMLALLREYGMNAVQASTKNYKWYLADEHTAINAMLGPIKYYRGHDTAELKAYLEELRILRKAEQDNG